MVVHEVLLLRGEVEVSDEASDTQLLDNVEDVELGVEASAGLDLELVLGRVAEAAAAAPRTREVLLAEEPPARVFERLAAVASLRKQVVLELNVALGDVRVGGALLLRLVDVVVKFLSHGVVEGEFLVGTKDVADETQAEGQVASEALESVGESLARRADRVALRVLSEAHVEHRVEWVVVVGILDDVINTVD